MIDLKCYYCGAKASVAAYVDEDGIGWMTICANSDCWDRASDDAFRQREARKRSDTDGK